MKKKLLCLLLCLCMVLPVMLMASCSEEKDDDEIELNFQNTGIKPITLVMYTIAGEGTTEESIARTQDALNAISETRYSTHIILRALPEDEYYDAIDEKIVAIEERMAADQAELDARTAAAKAAKAAGVTTILETESETMPETVETTIGEYGIPETVFPDDTGEQIDIFLINNREKYDEYFERGVLVQLDDELSGNSKILKDYIHPAFLTAAKRFGKTYAIPNNHMVGEFEYVVINRELFDKYYFDIDDIEGTGTLNDFVLSVAQNDEGITPVVDTYGVGSFVHYINDIPSVLGGYTVDRLSSGQYTELKIALGVRANMNDQAALMDWKMSGYLTKDAAALESGDFGVAFIKGDSTSVAQFDTEKYYVKVYKYPTFTDQNAYEGMYAVANYTRSITRSMEIITMLTVDEEFRNIFQYGAPGYNFERDVLTGEVTILNDDYNMNPVHTGNQFKLWQTDKMTAEELSLSADSWALAKEHNLNSSVNPYLGFVVKTDVPTEITKTVETIDENGDKVTEEVTLTFMEMSLVLEGLEEFSEEIFEKLENFEPGEYPRYANGMQLSSKVNITTPKKFVEYLLNVIAANEYVIEAMNPDNPNSIYNQYEALFK